MSFECAYRKLALHHSARLTREALADSARAHGLAPVYVIAGVEIVPRRWRRHLVDVVVHVADGDDILGMQFPDEARAAVTAAVDAILHAAHDAAHDAARPEPSATRDAPIGRAARA